jgi:hypothetical protein
MSESHKEAEWQDRDAALPRRQRRTQRKDAKRRSRIGIVEQDAVTQKVGGDGLNRRIGNAGDGNTDRPEHRDIVGEVGAQSSHLLIPRDGPIGHASGLIFCGAHIGYRVVAGAGGADIFDGKGDAPSVGDHQVL